MCFLRPVLGYKKEMCWGIDLLGVKGKTNLANEMFLLLLDLRPT